MEKSKETKNHSEIKRMARSLSRIKDSKSKKKSQGTNYMTIKKPKAVINPIPEKYSDRVSFIKNILYNELILRHLTSSPPKLTITHEGMAKYLASFSNEPVEMAALIYLWIANNITYDLSALQIKDVDISPENVFKTGRSISAGYAKLFQSMAHAVKIKTEFIHGYGKQFDFVAGSKLSEESKHAWNAINLYGKWYFIDCTWSAGHCDKVFNKSFNPFYFLPDPEFLIDTHRSDEEKWQLIHKTISHKMFELRIVKNFSKFYKKVIEREINLITHSHMEINTDEKNLQIKLGIPNLGYIIALKLGEEKIDGVTYSYQTSTSIMTIDLVFPQNGTYKLALFELISSSASQVYMEFLEYIINFNFVKKKANKEDKLKEEEKEKAKSTNRFKATKSPFKNDPMSITKKSHFNKDNLNNSTENIRPDYETLISLQKPKCYDNINAYIFEPKSKILKKGASVKFKIRVKNAQNVAVLDYKQWNFLKTKDDDIWEGTVTIKSDFVTVCSQKSSSLFTEVFEFKVK
jgi:hypothetical protein